MSQNYHIFCHNPENSLHEVLEYKVDMIMQNGEIVKFDQEIIGKATLVTAEKFMAGAV